jgi:hypothetical protein
MAATLFALARPQPQQRAVAIACTFAPSRPLRAAQKSAAASSSAPKVEAITAPAT